MIYEVLALVIPLVGLSGCVVFITRYWLRSRGAWRKTNVGRYFIIVYSNLAALFAITLVGRVFGEWPVTRWIVLVLYTSYAVLTWWPLRLLERAQVIAQVRQDAMEQD